MADTVLVNSDSDEESFSVLRRSSRSKRGTKQTSLKRNSKSSNDTVSTKQTQNSRGRRGQARGRGESKATQKSKTSTSSSSSILALDDDSVVLVDDSFCETVLSPTQDFNSTVAVKHTTNSTTDSTKTADDVEILMSENFTAVISKPIKTTKRGLAKRLCEVPQATDGNIIPSHKASVYSQAVGDRFKSLLHGAGSSGSKINMDDTGEHDPTDRKETDSKSASINVLNTFTDSLKLVSQPKVNLVNEAENMESPVRIPSPSPPVVVQRVARSLNKKLRNALQTLSKVKDSLEQVTPPKKQRRGRDSDVIIVEEETSTNKDIVVKVRYLTKVHRIQMKSNEPFHMLAHKLSQEIGEPEHNLGLFLHDRSLEVTETPKSVNLSVVDIIECLCINVSEDSICSSDAVELVIQCRNNKSKTTIIANKRRPLSDVIQKYAKMNNRNAISLVFSFDGDDIEPSDTPSKLEMEDQDVIDVIYV